MVEIKLNLSLLFYMNHAPYIFRSCDQIVNNVRSEEIMLNLLSPTIKSNNPHPSLKPILLDDLAVV